MLGGHWGAGALRPVPCRDRACAGPGRGSAGGVLAAAGVAFALSGVWLWRVAVAAGVLLGLPLVALVCAAPWSVRVWLAGRVRLGVRGRGGAKFYPMTLEPLISPTSQLCSFLAGALLPSQPSVCIMYFSAHFLPS